MFWNLAINKKNIPGKIFASNSIPVHTGKRRICTAVLSNIQQVTDITRVSVQKQHESSSL